MTTPSYVIDRYLKEIEDKIGLIGKTLTKKERDNLRRNVLEFKKPNEVMVVNNYKKTLIKNDLENIINFYYINECTMSGFGVIFKNSSRYANVPGKILIYLLSQRKVAKKKMLSHVNDVDQTYHDNYDIIQKIFKLLGNSWYGSFAESNFHFFNPFCGPSTTYTGRHIIISAIMGFEGLLADNIKFHNFGEMIHFFYNISTREETNENISLGLYEDITPELFIARFTKNSIFELTDVHIQYLIDIYNNSPDLLIEKYYYKNNLTELLSVDIVMELIGSLVCSDFLNPEKPPEEIKDGLIDFNTLVDYYIAYPYQIQNKEEKVESLVRKTILLTDTDSTFIYLDTILNQIKSSLSLDVTQNENVCLVNVLTYVITNFISKVFYILTSNMGVVESDKHLVSMKNEFMFSRVMLTRNKKSYASKVLMKEGEMYKKPKFDIKGIKIKTITTPKPARILFNKILEEEILNTPTINPLSTFKRFIDFEELIHTSIGDLETKFLKPTTYGVLERYKAPFQQQVVRGVLLWNALNPSEYIENMSQVYLIKFKTNTYEDLPKLIDKDILDIIEEKYFSILSVATKADASDGEDIPINVNEDEDDDQPAKPVKVLKTLKDYGLSCIAIPKTKVHFPDIFSKLIDEPVIVNDVISTGNILLECIGYSVFKSNTYNTFSNIIEF